MKQVDVVTPGGETLSCVTCVLPKSLLDNTAYDCRPSPAYIDVIVRGARKVQLPDHYVAFLEAVETNGETEEPEVYKQTVAQL